MGDVAPNFNRRDFTCHCAHCMADPQAPATKQEVIDDVQGIRNLLGQPLVIARGVSCAAHNASIGGAGDSRHLPEHADGVDFATSSSNEAYKIVGALIIQRKFTFIELAKDHVHADQRPGAYRLITESQA